MFYNLIFNLVKMDTTNFINFLNSIITFIVGTFAWFIYSKQKKDFKSGIATLIYLEIENAEENISFLIRNQIDGVQNYQVFYSIRKILQTDNWNKYSYLFVKDFGVNDFKKINSFYENCRKANYDLELLHDIKKIGITQRANELQSLLIDLAKDNQDILIYKSEKERITNILHNDIYWYEAHSPIISLIGFIRSINLIITTTTGEKIKYIAKIN